jgi:tetratricopeptide (TPR) repeat protein
VIGHHTPSLDKEDLARRALSEGDEEGALPLVRAEAEQTSDARLWQWVGLLERALDEHAHALASFDKAARLAPADASVAHGRARVALEAGMPAVDLFRTAIRLAPTDGEVLLGYAAAMFASGFGDQAEAMLDLALSRSPLWLQGHGQLAQLRATLGKRELAIQSVERALQAHPAHEPLWTTLFGILLQAQQFPELDEAIARARRASLSEQTLALYESIAAAELGQTSRADNLFAKLRDDLRASVEVWRIRHLLRSGRISKAIAAIDAELETDRAALVWPYAAIAWRLAGDQRWQWLEGDLDRLVSVIDLTSELPDIAQLDRTLRGLHRAKGEYLDQSVRGGSQTDDPLFSSIDPIIRRLRGAVVGAIERFVGDLPPPDPNHPLLAPPRNRRVRFSGSWSVLLRGGGHHSNHVHPQGWISSALYVALPTRTAGDPERAGWLTLGEPQKELGLDLPPFRYVEPRVGQLVLFPSWMWHGTIPFESGERLTVAFDVQPPR